ncbi:hypothetical protein ACFVWG_20255 [Kribbella sp. NPDC058245]|uniref:hypothetical protein n=1 Tax=Kribbella sp. NPDC058245 TaxID=3346399 RepID=UPI0036EF18CB
MRSFMGAHFQRHGRSVQSGGSSSQYGDVLAFELGEVDPIACVGGQVRGKRAEVRRQSASVALDARGQYQFSSRLDPFVHVAAGTGHRKPEGKVVGGLG